jgi:hypothetical protein
MGRTAKLHHPGLARLVSICLGLMLCAGLLGGCFPVCPWTDYFYSLTVVNRSQQSIVVSVLSERWTVRPCSVRHATAGTGPPTNWEKQVTVRDADGAVLDSWAVTGCKAPSGPCLIEVVYPRNGDEGCPPDTRTQYNLAIANGRKRDLRVYVEGREIGVVPSQGEATLGPIDGDWATTLYQPLEEFRDADGRVLQPVRDYWVSAAPVDYDLGNMPLVRIHVGGG